MNLIMQITRNAPAVCAAWGSSVQTASLMGARHAGTPPPYKQHTLARISGRSNQFTTLLLMFTIVDLALWWWWRVCWFVTGSSIPRVPPVFGTKRNATPEEPKWMSSLKLCEWVHLTRADPYPQWALCCAYIFIESLRVLCARCCTLWFYLLNTPSVQPALK